MLSKAVDISPENGTYILNYAIALTTGGNAGEALKWFENALPKLKEHPNYPIALANYALALGKCGYADNGIRCLKQAEQAGYHNIQGLREQLEGMGIFYH